VRLSASLAFHPSAQAVSAIVHAKIDATLASRWEIYLM
jgi:hypothetical protein